MGTAGACGACAPGLPAGFKQQAATATDGERRDGVGMSVWEVRKLVLVFLVFFSLRCLEVRPDSTLLEVT